uniref:Uncharacterized protein n=1 Tax=Mantoniella antarctica TaxID=81844 RepID=A0A7S0S9W0_9CHLO|mmetsp:Transcript_15635/g.38377  ORF Transcript_15635/g.38377 Transcript_15635/m.38377 type:complete len:105 (+) Transcript_15635:68-382(+)
MCIVYLSLIHTTGRARKFGRRSYQSTHTHTHTHVDAHSNAATVFVASSQYHATTYVPPLQPSSSSRSGGVDVGGGGGGLRGACVRQPPLAPAQTAHNVSCALNA